MKKSLTTVLALLIVVFSYAQINPAPVQIAESERSLVSKGVSSNSLTVELPGANEKTALKVWKDFIKEHGAKAKKQKKTGEWYSEGASIEAVNGENPVNVTAKVDKNSTGSTLTLWIGMSDDLYVSSAAFPNDYAGAENFLAEYTKEVQRTLTKMELEEEEKKLKNLKKELTKLERQNKGYHKDIEDAKKRIAKAEKNIETNVQEQEETGADIEEQIKAVEKVRKKLQNI